MSEEITTAAEAEDQPKARGRAKPKFRKASEFAAYEIAEGVTTAAEAEALGLIVVETDGRGNVTAYGRYPDAA